jgi:hypothetical protein
VILHIINLGSSPNISNLCGIKLKYTYLFINENSIYYLAQEAQLVERNSEDV